MIEPNASGPFKLREFDPNQAIVFERNPGYHTPAGVSYAAYLFAPFDLGSLLYEAGEIDLGFVDAQTFDRVRDPADPLSGQWQTTTSLCTLMLRLDVARPPLDDPQVRQALALALDRAALRTTLAGPEAVLAETVLPPGLPGFAADLPRQTFNLDQAKAALAASNYAADMPPIVLADPGGPLQPSAIGAAVAAMWRDHLGLTVNLEVLTSSAKPAPGESHGHVMVYNWCADYPDPENFLEVLFHSGSTFNIAAYANPQVDAWLDEARAHPDPALRFALYRQVETQLLTDVAVIPWLHPTYERLVKPYVQGYVLAPMGVPIVHRITLEPFMP
jgi:oligopeptide transport system substrate-binding protein